MVAGCPLSGPHCSPYCCAVECETAAGAQQLQAALLQLQARMPPLAAYIGHCQVLTPPPSDWPAD